VKAIFRTAWPYQQDRMNLPVKDLEAAIPFYETVMGFQVVSRKDSLPKSAVLGRDEIQIGLAENGGDPTQEGCFFEVDDVEAAVEELNGNGLEKERGDSLSTEKHGETSWKVFFVVAPDGLCYCLGERQTEAQGEKEVLGDIAP
jgi:lactoylglutathione lyase